MKKQKTKTYKKVCTNHKWEPTRIYVVESYACEIRWKCQKCPAILDLKMNPTRPEEIKITKTY